MHSTLLHLSRGPRGIALACATVLCLAAPLAAQQPAATAPLPPILPSTGDTSPFRQLELPTPNAFRSASGMPGPMYWQQKADYAIRVSLDTADHSIHGTEILTYTNNSPDTLRYIWVQVDENLNAPDDRMAILQGPARQTDPGFHGGVTIEHLNVLRGGTGPRATATAAPLTYRVNGTMMRVDLDKPLAPNGVLKLDIAWHHQIPTGGRTGRTKQGNLGWLYQVAEWYPRMAVYDDVRGWNVDQYIGTGEFYLEYGDFDVAITMPAGFTVTATGVLQNPAEVLPAMIRARLAAAAHADTIVRVIRPDELGKSTLLPAGVGATRTWKFHATNVRDFAWATAPNYAWDATSWDGILMQAFYPPDQIGSWRTAADMTRHAVMIHSRWFHYPYPVATSAQGPVGGMEYPMMTFDDDQNEKELYYTIAHEQGHEWYPMIVGSQERLYPWMDEGFNTFIDWFSFRDRYPTDTTRIQTLEFGAMSAWQKFLAGHRSESPIIEGADRATSAASGGWNSYGRPAVGLHFLREQVLDSAVFDRAFAEYTRRWAFRHPTPADFFRSINDGVGEDLSWFWRSWFLRTDHLDQAVDSVLVGTVRGKPLARVFLSNKREMIAPVEMRITNSDGSVRNLKLPVEAWLHGSRTVLPLAVDGGVVPVKVELDPRGVYPDVDRTNNSWTAPGGGH